MLKKKSLQAVETREKMHGGLGQVYIRHHLKPIELHAKCRLCAELILPPGASIGPHAHDLEDEIYIIQHGRGIVNDNGVETEISAGDAMITGKGAMHSIKNTGDTDLLVTAIIIQY